MKRVCTVWSSRQTALTAGCTSVLNNLDGLQSTDGHLDHSLTQTYRHEDCHGMNSCPFFCGRKSMQVHATLGGLLWVLLKRFQHTVHFLVVWRAAPTCSKWLSSWRTLPTKCSSREGSWHSEPTIQHPFGSWRFIDPKAFQNKRKQGSNKGQMPVWGLFACMYSGSVMCYCGEARVTDRQREAGATNALVTLCLMHDNSVWYGVWLTDWLILLYDCSERCVVFNFTPLQKDVKWNWDVLLIAITLCLGKERERYADTIKLRLRRRRPDNERMFESWSLHIEILIVCYFCPKRSHSTFQ